MKLMLAFMLTFQKINVWQLTRTENLSILQFISFKIPLLLSCINEGTVAVQHRICLRCISFEKNKKIHLTESLTIAKKKKKI